MVVELIAQGIDVWAVMPGGSAQRAATRFAEIFGAVDVTFFPTAAAAVTEFLEQRE